MHPYATNQDKRNIYLFLAAGSVALAYLFAWLTTRLQISIPWWVDAPSVMAFFAILNGMFNNWLWRTPLGRLLVKTPNLNGEWIGKIASSFDDHAKQLEGVMHIEQTWTEISIILTTEGSKSRNLSGLIKSNNVSTAEISYEYMNEPNAQAAPTMSIHRGTAYLTFSTMKEKRVLNGQYYTGRGRQNIGSLHFEKSN